MNRAKCKGCGDVIVSASEHDEVFCSCASISVGGGPGPFACRASDWNLFLRVDDEGNEIVPIIVDKLLDVASNEVAPSEPVPAKVDGVPSTSELIDMLDAIRPDPSMDSSAYRQPVDQCELAQVVMIVSCVLRDLLAHVKAINSRTPAKPKAKPKAKRKVPANRRLRTIKPTKDVTT